MRIYPYALPTCFNAEAAARETSESDASGLEAAMMGVSENWSIR
jgi:hypothetical protein